MKPLSLTLKGFLGIRDGLGRDALTLDVERLAGGGQLIAIAGPNGRGKTTVMDNLHPYLSMPSRATSAGPGEFSYYDHVYLPENEKKLIWTHEGRRYRSHILFRLNGKRKTEAYLFVQGAAGWAPVRLDDGTVSDGKVETYERCVEALLGSAETFFTSVFSAQGKRQLTAYKNAEIKSLLADLLGLDEIRVLGQKAAETAKLLKAGLGAMRHEQAGLNDAARVTEAERVRLSGAGMRVARAALARQVAQQELDAMRAAQAHLSAERQLAQRTEARRSELHAERQALVQSGRDAQQSLAQQQAREEQRLAQLLQRIAARTLEARLRTRSLEEKRAALDKVLLGAAAAGRAGRRLALAERLVALRTRRVVQLRQNVQRLAELEGKETLALQSLAAIEREAGQASLKAAELTRRFTLTEKVPCFGTDLQGRCHLLGDARAAKALVPDASMHIARLARQKDDIREQLTALGAQRVALAGLPSRLDGEERALGLTRMRASRCAVQAARADEIERARAALSGVEQELAALNESRGGGGGSSSGDGETTEEFVERQHIEAACRAIAAEREGQAARAGDARQRIERAIAALPQSFDEQRFLSAGRAVEHAAGVVAAAEQAHVKALRDAQALDLAQRQAFELATRKARVASRTAAVETELGNWVLFSKCLSNDGVIALAIDDAGPALSGLANDLLLDSYGTRFTVSIRTLLETGKGEPREGFDILVHDAESAESKSVGLMSGGERVWINACLVRAVALYLAQHAGRRYATLFSDEADGSLDPERKRMFMAMKREVLRLGAYDQEFFVSQTPELTALADAVIDLEQFNDGKKSSPCDAGSR